MKALIQRVTRASVTIDGVNVGEIEAGLVVLLGLDRGDNLGNGLRLLAKVLDYRVFADAEGRMNRSVRDVGGGVLLISQFTLSAQTGKGLRPGFSEAMPPQHAETLYLELLSQLQTMYPRVSAGVFGANMQVSLVNDGPVTFLLETVPD